MKAKREEGKTVHTKKKSPWRHRAGSMTERKEETGPRRGRWEGIRMSAQQRNGATQVDIKLLHNNIMGEGA